ncbi:MAG: Ribosome maturation factor RimM [Eubacteriales bacterium SKADARSKE-1]|nr:Ribosome maturation factor RimM [Eubacteriales bacterium SKADARSKE-1]
MKKKYLEVGKIVATHGLNGEIKVAPWCDSGEFLCSFSNIYFKNGQEKIKVLSGKVHKNVVILKFEGINTIDTAKTLCGQIIYIDRDDAELNEGEYFIQDIIGIDVFDNNTGRYYGKVTDVLKTGANDVYEITSENYKKYLIPVIDDVIVDMDMDGGTLKIVPLKGIFDDEN